MAFEARVSRWRTGWLVAGAAGFVVIGLWLVGAFGAAHPVGIDMTILGWLAILFFGLCGAGWATQLCQKGVVMRIDADGVYWRRWSAQTIPWDAIVRVNATMVGRQAMLCLFLDRPDRYRGSGVLGRLAPMNKSMGYGDIALSTNGTDRSFDDLVAAVDHFSPMRSA